MDSTCTSGTVNALRIQMVVAVLVVLVVPGSQAVLIRASFTTPVPKPPRPDFQAASSKAVSAQSPEAGSMLVYRHSA
jgi:hypothetical protein